MKIDEFIDIEKLVTYTTEYKNIDGSWLLYQTHDNYLAALTNAVEKKQDEGGEWRVVSVTTDISYIK